MKRYYQSLVITLKTSRQIGTTKKFVKIFFYVSSEWKAVNRRQNSVIKINISNVVANHLSNQQ
jgi:hypothetical protein